MTPVQQVNETAAMILAVRGATASAPAAFTGRNANR